MRCVVVVSEETCHDLGRASNGRLLRGLTAPQVRDLIAGRPLRTTAEQPVLRDRRGPRRTATNLHSRRNRR